MMIKFYDTAVKKSAVFIGGEMNQNQLYEYAKETYAEYGVDTEKVLHILKETPVSLHCWQGDDVGGFEKAGSELSGGGIQVTGNYPGKARTIDELRCDIEKVMSLVPGTYRINLHANYADFGGKKPADRDALEPAFFESWLDWALSKGLKIDFNSTFFSHPKAEGLTLCSKDKGIRDFWIEHAKRCREIGAFFGKKQGDPCIHNLWIADGMKDLPADRKAYREILCASLDEIYAEKIPETYLKDSVESKVFGIGSEAYVAGSHEFYMGYAITRGKLLTLDMGHFHPMENVADKLSAIMLFIKEIFLHLSRPMRWDSDHVVILNDELRLMCEEIVNSGRMKDIHIGLDFFDGSINRIGAWTLGCRSAQKGLLAALLLPRKRLTQSEDCGNYFERLALFEAAKTLPFSILWNEYCRRCGIPSDREMSTLVEAYDKEVTSKRV